jgi:hypothetical protein
MVQAKGFLGTRLRGITKGASFSLKNKNCIELLDSDPVPVPEENFPASQSSTLETLKLKGDVPTRVTVVILPTGIVSRTKWTPRAIHNLRVFTTLT